MNQGFVPLFDISDMEPRQSECLDETAFVCESHSVMKTRGMVSV